jgi:transcriptional regulator with XRE-family HTH domain
MDFAKQLGRRMRRARIERGITQTELAAAAEVGANYVPRLERGEMVPSVEAAFRSLDSLCGRTSRRGAEEAIEALSHLASSDAATLRRVADAVERASGSSRRGPVGRP